MKIRQATIEEFEMLWEYSNSPTYKYFVKNIKDENVEFWTIEKSKNLVGELYIFWNSEDKDEANGIDRAYLCAFRIKEEYQGQGYGQSLMKTVLNRIKEKGFREVTIGIDNSEYEKLNVIYSKLGFSSVIKQTNTDYHFINENHKPTTYEVAYSLKLNIL